VNDRDVIRDILEDCQTDALVTARHADDLADEIVAGLVARGLSIVHVTPAQRALRR
jgi:hypothetical protein